MNKDRIAAVAIIVLVLVAITIAALLAVGCASTSVAYSPPPTLVAESVGRLVVYGLVKSGQVNELELATARPYLCYIRSIVTSEPADTPVAILAVIEAEADRWGGSLEESDRRAILDAVAMIVEGLRIEGDRTLEEEQAAEFAAATLDGMLAAIDVVVPAQ